VPPLHSHPSRNMNVCGRLRRIRVCDRGERQHLSTIRLCPVKECERAPRLSGSVCLISQTSTTVIQLFVLSISSWICGLFREMTTESLCAVKLSQALETSITEKRPLVDDRVFCFPGIMQLPSIHTIATRTITKQSKSSVRRSG
jgi:hypothetical protein